MGMFFFSSRRRHTRYWRDWSSDVCSSDLPLVAQRFGAERVRAGGQRLHPARHEGQHLGHLEEGPPPRQQPDRLDVPRLGLVPRRPVPRLQLCHGEMLDDARHDPAPEPWPFSPLPATPTPEPASPVRQSAGFRMMGSLLPTTGNSCETIEGGIGPELLEGGRGGDLLFDDPAGEPYARDTLLRAGSDDVLT